MAKLAGCPALTRLDASVRSQNENDTPKTFMVTQKQTKQIRSARENRTGFAVVVPFICRSCQRVMLMKHESYERPHLQTNIAEFPKMGITLKSTHTHQNWHKTESMCRHLMALYVAADVQNRLVLAVGNVCCVK